MALTEFVANFVELSHVQTCSVEHLAVLKKIIPGAVHEMMRRDRDGYTIGVSWWHQNFPTHAEYLFVFRDAKIKY